MRIGIMQPYFFPYIGYFSLIKHTDQFILFDTPQFIRHGWIERNRILNPNGEWQYISVSLMKHGQKTPINEIKINNTIDWKRKILDQLVHYKKAPNYEKVTAVVKDIFSDDFSDIVSLNKSALIKICKYLQIKTDISVFSDMHLKIDEVNSADEWALNICKAMEGVTEYWNPPGGKEFFDIRKYKEAGICIKFPRINIREYRQGRHAFEGSLSIIDVMMFNSISEICDMLDDYEFI